MQSRRTLGYFSLRSINIAHFAAALRRIGLSYIRDTSAILPVICGDDWAAFRLARFCQHRGFYVQAIPHPVVPKGTARLRISVTAGHRTDDIDSFVSVLNEGMNELAIDRNG